MLAGPLALSACLEVQDPCIAVSALQGAGAVLGQSCVGVDGYPGAICPGCGIMGKPCNLPLIAKLLLNPAQTQTDMDLDSGVTPGPCTRDSDCVHRCSVDKAKPSINLEDAGLVSSFMHTFLGDPLPPTPTPPAAPQQVRTYHRHALSASTWQVTRLHTGQQAGSSRAPEHSCWDLHPVKALH